MAFIFSLVHTQMMVSMGLDRQVRIFKFATGKLFRKYDESLAVLSEMQQAGTSSLKLDDMEFGRRLAIEREIEKSELKSRITASAFSSPLHGHWGTPREGAC